MKATFKTLATLAVAATLSLAGCKKEKIEPLTPDTPGEEPVENIFAGTSWSSHMENTIEYQPGVMVNVSYDFSLDFLDTVNGDLFTDMYLYVPAYPSASQGANDTDPFNYSINGDSVMLQFYYFNSDIGDTVFYTNSLVYDKETNTLTFDCRDEYMRQMMGTSVVFFSKNEEVKN